MKIGIVGYQGCGKSTLFEWLTGAMVDASLSHTTQSAMALLPDERLERLREIYLPKKVTQASLELVDTPGLARSHEGSAQRLSLIREADALVHVVDSFSDPNPLATLTSFDEDLLLADAEIISRRVEKLRESVKKPRPTRDQELAELAALEPLDAALSEGESLMKLELSDEQQKATKAFQLLTRKPRLVVFNTADDEQNSRRFVETGPAGMEAVALPVGFELELARMEPEERAEFEAEMGTARIDRTTLLRRILDVSGQILYFTAGDKEVRSWLLRRGGTAVEAAANVHTDLARGFVRAETMTCDDLFRLGSEREVKAANLMRREPKNYRVADGDVLLILASV